jgi:hypothetical protein
MMKRAIGYTAVAMYFVGCSGLIALFSWLDWPNIRQNFWNLLDPFTYLNVLVAMLTLPLFWILLVLALAGWALGAWGNKMPEEA